NVSALLKCTFIVVLPSQSDLPVHMWKNSRTRLSPWGSSDTHSTRHSYENCLRAIIAGSRLISSSGVRTMILLRLCPSTSLLVERHHSDILQSCTGLSVSRISHPPISVSMLAYDRIWSMRSRNT